MPSVTADNNRIAWRYTDDSTPAVNYAISAKQVYVEHATDAAKYGGQAAAATDRRIPKDLKPRRVKCVAAGSPDKWVVAYSTAATIWTTPGTTLTLDANGIDILYTTTGRRRPEVYRDTTRQTT